MTKTNLDNNVRTRLNNGDILNNLVKQKIYANDNFDCKKEVALWKAVILQALVDLKSQSKKKMAKVNRIKAILWLNLQNKDFLISCSRADLDPLYVWEKSQALKKANPLI